MSKQLNREEAWALLTEYNQDPFHLHHARTVEGVMRYFAQELGYGDEVDFWGIVGLLHDLDFERYPDQHCIQSQEIMRERDLDERLIHATASHGYGITVDIQPEHEMEKVLFATADGSGRTRRCLRNSPTTWSSTTRPAPSCSFSSPLVSAAPWLLPPGWSL